VTTLHLVVPDCIDDPERPSGGNAYDRRVCDGLRADGWAVREHPLPGAWPRPDAQARAALARVLGTLPDGALALLDGLVASCLPGVVVPESGRLRLVVLVHMPLGGAADGPFSLAATRERAVLSAVAGVVTTSEWTRRLVLERYAVSPARVHVAEPGVEPADVAPGTPGGGELLCVGSLAPGKGHDQLLAALATLADLPWRCTCVGSQVIDRPWVERLRRQAETAGIAHRVRFVGPLARAELARRYAAADLLVHASRAETYGLVVTEALARGVPVVATEVGGLPEALGHAPDGARPGLLVPAGDHQALSRALRSWLGDGEVRERLRSSASGRRRTLSDWSVTSGRVAHVLAGVARDELAAPGVRTSSDDGDGEGVVVPVPGSQHRDDRRRR
jgi:glycosyltransferase involved in cell wall biosynthesis